MSINTKLEALEHTNEFLTQSRYERIAELEAENAKLKERLKLRPHDLMHRLDELEADRDYWKEAFEEAAGDVISSEHERDEYYEGYRTLMNRCAELCQLVRDMHKELQGASGVFLMGYIEKRMHELGIEVPNDRMQA